MANIVFNLLFPLNQYVQLDEYRGWGAIDSCLISAQIVGISKGDCIFRLQAKMKLITICNIFKYPWFILYICISLNLSVLQCVNETSIKDRKVPWSCTRTSYSGVYAAVHVYTTTTFWLDHVLDKPRQWKGGNFCKNIN